MSWCSPCNTGWTETQVIPAPDSRVLRLRACSTTISPLYSLYKYICIYSHSVTSKLLLLCSCKHRKLRHREVTLRKPTHRNTSHFTVCLFCSTNVSNKAACSKLPLYVSRFEFVILGFERIRKTQRSCLA